MVSIKNKIKTNVKLLTIDDPQPNFEQLLKQTQSQLTCSSFRGDKKNDHKIKDEFYKENDPDISILSTIKTNQHVEKDQQIEKYSNICKLLFDDKPQKEIKDIQYISFQVDILDKSTIIPVIHEEDVNLLENDQFLEEIENFRKFYPDEENPQNQEQDEEYQNDQIEEKKEQQVKKQDKIPEVTEKKHIFRVRKQHSLKKDPPVEKQAILLKQQKTNPFEFFDTEYKKQMQIQTIGILENNKQKINQKIMARSANNFNKR